MGNSTSTLSTSDQSPRLNQVLNFYENFQTGIAQRPVLLTRLRLRNQVYDQSHETTASYVPKILSGVNTQNILAGQESYDNFFQTCRLDSELLRFGAPVLNLHGFISSLDDAVQDDYEDEVTSISHSPSDSPSFSPLFSARLGEPYNMQSSCVCPNEELREAPPPPYSELPIQSPVPEDPPPSYLESLFHYSANPQTEYLRNDSLPFSSITLTAGSACYY